MAEHITEIISLSDRPIILIFCHQGLLRKSDSFTPNVGAEYKGVAIIHQYVAILAMSPKWIEAYLLWNMSIKSNVLYRTVPLLMTLSDLEPQFQGRNIV